MLFPREIITKKNLTAKHPFGMHDKFQPFKDKSNDSNSINIIASHNIIKDFILECFTLTLHPQPNIT